MLFHPLITELKKQTKGKNQWEKGNDQKARTMVQRVKKQMLPLLGKNDLLVLTQKVNKSFFSRIGGAEKHRWSCYKSKMQVGV